MKKKILFLSPLPPPYYGSSMSSEMCLKILESSNKFEVKNIKLNYSKEMSDIGKFNLAKIFGFFKTKKEIKKALKEFKPDLIYFVPATSSWGFKRDYSFLRYIKKTYSGRIIFHIRSRILNKDWENSSFRKKLIEILSGEKAIILGNELIKDLHKIIQKSSIFVLPNAIKNEISTKKFKDIIVKRRKRNSFNLLFLSNMDFSKGWVKVLESCKILKERNIRFKCNFVGAFPGEKERKVFFRFIEENSLREYVAYLGKSTGEDKNKILEDSDILIFPTDYNLETFGRVILEGMMFGLPVIANGIATIPSTVSEGKSGFILEDNSPDEIVRFILKLQDKRLREDFGREGRKRFLKDFELIKYSKKFIKIINSC